MSEYKNIEKIKPEILLALVRDILDHSIDFEYISGVQPFLMSFSNQKYYVYVKNISSAYFSDRDKTTRAQLPIKPKFEAIKSSPYPFIFLGYDGINDVFVCWNYHKAKERLNIGKSVSFYSRTFFQSEVKVGEFNRRQLKNGDLPVLFKRSSLIEFFQKIETFFTKEKESSINYPGIFSNVNNEEKFINYLKNNKKLSAKTIKNYVNALRSRISLGLKNYFIPSLDSIFYINDLAKLEELNDLLFQKEEYKLLNKVGKNMYSCAFDSYLSFIRNNAIFEIQESNNSLQDMPELYIADGKLLKINDLKLLKEIKSLIESNRLLSAAQIVGDFYKNQYPNMELSDWINLVRKI
ncbi:MAG: hypothetical protein V4638_07370 [Bacteroidota bacterium]